MWHYRYNAFDQLTDVTTPDGRHWQYTYDALSRRATKQRLDHDGTVADLIRYTWDGTHLLEQSSGDTTTRWNYQHGSYTPLTQAVSRTSDIDRLWDQRAVDTEFYAIVTDLVGTPIELVDPRTADRVADATTDLWGNTIWHGATDTPLRFPGQYHDPETGLHYNLHRYYNPDTARYLTQDPPPHPTRTPTLTTPPDGPTHSAWCRRRVMGQTGKRSNMTTTITQGFEQEDSRIRLGTTFRTHLMTRYCGGNR
ncbi:RHS repeat-associated core domain-containing protein [Rhodococcus opacus]|uniref:RHS repeat-associated core domain-containing protein n=1 Tax=Rhodococcus opacus TaxID=37919 RepID=UPI003AAFCA3F